MHAPNALKPTDRRDRIVVIDVLRGLALLGILTANITYFSGTIHVPLETMETLDQIVMTGTGIFAGYTFNTLFSFLFGFGFMMFFDRSEARGRNPLPAYARRLALLLAIGMAHAVFLWFGDILMYYACLGALLPLFRRRRPKTLVRWAGGILVIPLTLLVGCVVFGPTVFPSDPVVAVDAATAVQGIQLYAQGTYTDIFQANLGEVIPSFVGYLWLSLILFPMFLMGVWAQKTRFFERIGELKPRIRLTAIAGMITGATMLAPLAFSEQLGYIGAENLLETMSLMCSGVAFCTANLCAIVLAFEHPRVRRLLAVFRNPGYLSLTCYLSQTLIGCLLFNGYGLGLHGSLSPVSCLAVVFAIFTLQTLGSTLWLTYFRMGPLEWVWRAATYLNRPRFRR